MAITQVPPALLTSTTGTGTTVALSASPTFTGTVTTPGVTFSDSSIQTAAASPYVLKNRIINGAMVIDQRNAGAAVTGLTAGAYTLDRWTAFQNYGTVTTQQSTTAPTGYKNSFYTTVTSTASVSANSIYTIVQYLEGYNVADLDWGTANAKTITISFQVRSSVTGTYGVFIRNSAADRYYATTFSIPTANTFTSVSVTIAGDTAGTWLTTNGIGLTLGITLGAGATRQGTANTWTGSSNGPYTTSSQVDWMSNTSATFYITGVQLEIGSSATPFERRLYNQELANCQRYYYNYVNAALGVANPIGISANFSTTRIFTVVKYPVTMRTAPTISATNGAYYVTYYNGTATAINVAPFLQASSTEAYNMEFTPSSAVTLNAAGFTQTSGVGGFISFSAEL